MYYCLHSKKGKSRGPEGQGAGVISKGNIDLQMYRYVSLSTICLTRFKVIIILHLYIHATFIRTNISLP